MLFDRPAVHADAVGEVGAIEHIVLGQLVFAAHAAGLADADLRRDLGDVGALEAGRRLADELEGVPHLPAPLDLAPGELPGVDPAHGGAVGIADLREVGAPFDRVGLRPHDRLLAREAPAFALGLLHQLGDALPGLARLLRIDAADAVHRRRIEHVALAVAYFVRRAA